MYRAIRIGRTGSESFQYRFYSYFSPVHKRERGTIGNSPFIQEIRDHLDDEVYNIDLHPIKH